MSKLRAILISLSVLLLLVLSSSVSSIFPTVLNSLGTSLENSDDYGSHLINSPPLHSAYAQSGLASQWTGTYTDSIQVNDPNSGDQKTTDEGQFSFDIQNGGLIVGNGTGHWYYSCTNPATTYSICPLTKDSAYSFTLSGQVIGGVSIIFNENQPTYPPSPGGDTGLDYCACDFPNAYSGETFSKNYTSADSSVSWSFSMTIFGPPLDLTITGMVTSTATCKVSGAVSSIATSTVPCSAPDSLVGLVKFNDLPQTNGIAQKLSQSKPAFMQTTSTDANSNYQFEFQEPGVTPPNMVVVSTLWYNENTFAITNGITDSSGTLIPLYVAMCVGDLSSSCVKWQPNGDGAYKAVVNFVYGSFGSEDQSQFMSLEGWKLNAVPNIDALMADGIMAYFYSYEAIHYFETLGVAQLDPLPVQIGISNTLCASSGGALAYYDEPTTVPSPFGDIGIRGLIQATGGSITICDVESSIHASDAPMNIEWHELSHYLEYELYQVPPAQQGGQIVCCGTDHGGYFVNSASNYGLSEGFAEFGAMLIAQYYGNPASYLYPAGTSVFNLEEDLRIWGPVISCLPGPVASCVTAPTAGEPPLPSTKVYEELAIAGLLWNLHDGNGGVCEVGWSTVYPTSCDTLSLSASIILSLFAKSKPNNVDDLYKALLNTAMISQTPVDMIFVNHGVYDNYQDDYIQRPGDTIGESGGGIYNGPRYDPAPSSASNNNKIEEEVASAPIMNLEPGGSFIMLNGTTSGSTSVLNISVAFAKPFGNWSYSYTINATSGVPFYFEMPPQYFPSNATISQLTGSQSVQLATINSSEYWNYFISAPSNNSVFMSISLVNSTQSNVQTGSSSSSFLQSSASTSSAGAIGVVSLTSSATSTPSAVSSSFTATLTSTPRSSSGTLFGISDEYLAVFFFIFLFVLVPVVGSMIRSRTRRSRRSSTGTTAMYSPYPAQGSNNALRSGESPNDFGASIPADITKTQYIILRLFSQGFKNPGEIAKHLSMDKSSVESETIILKSNGYLTEQNKLTPKAIDLLDR